MINSVNPCLLVKVYALTKKMKNKTSNKVGLTFGASAILVVIASTIGMLIAGTTIVRAAFAQGAILAPGQGTPRTNPSEGSPPPGHVGECGTDGLDCSFGNPGQCQSVGGTFGGHPDNDCFAR